MKTILYTSFALVAFAFNSILCRLALQTDEIDWASFTLVRLVSGAATLIVIYVSFNKKKDYVKRGSWTSGVRAVVIFGGLYQPLARRETAAVRVVIRQGRRESSS